MVASDADVRVSETAEQAAEASAKYIIHELRDALNDAPFATFAISGGSSPKLLFTRLASAGFDWSRVHIFWVDERCVPPTDDRSNYKLAEDTLLKPSGISAENIHRIRGEANPDEAAAEYVRDIRGFFRLSDGQMPAFDILHRGMGPDGHTASLFPGEPLMQNRTDIAAHVWVEKMKMDRVTLLPGVLEAAKRTVLQATGEEKQDALLNVLFGDEDPMKYPCQIASRDAKAVWFLDEAAAAKL